VAIFQHVGYARRNSQVVFEYIDLPVAVADEIRAGDVTPDAVRRIEADALRAE
jgi:hypothetical protein